VRVRGFHHVTCIASHPQANANFYSGILGLRLIKKTVHFDNERVYHLYYGDAAGTPGSVVTFFPFAHPEPALRGSDSIQEFAFAVPGGSCDFWTSRLDACRIEAGHWAGEFGRRVLRFRDHDGQRLALVETPGCEQRPYWHDGAIDGTRALRGVQGIRLGVAHVDREIEMATTLLGLTIRASRGSVTRLVFNGDGDDRQDMEGDGGRYVEIEDMHGVPPAPRLPLEGAPAMAGTVNHVAFDAGSEASQLAFRERFISAGFTVTPVKDRHYFKSIYLIDPGGIRVEIAASHAAGFTRDEPFDRLGESLMLPPWLERLRAQYEQALPSIESARRPVHGRQ